jgi:hypothetical protein
LNGDRAPDLYLCNDFQSPDRLWWNDGHGRFRAASPVALRHTSMFSMGVDAGDLNRDGHDDLVISDMLMQRHESRQLRLGDVPPVFLGIGAFEDRPQYSFNTLHLSRGDGTYAELAWQASAAASGWTWCPVLLDVDLDGYEDILFPTGHQLDMMNIDVILQAEVIKAQRKLSRQELLELRNMFARFDTPNVAFRNRGDLTFEDASDAWGFTDATVSQGIALGDLDRDGDLDVVVNNLNGPAGLYRNDSAASRVAVRLKGLPPNTQGVGARIRVLGGPVPEQAQEIVCGGHYLSSDESLRVFAAGTNNKSLRIEVTWRNGRQSVIDPAAPNHLYEIREDGSIPAVPSASPSPPPIWFEDLLPPETRHHEQPFDDFARQPLLPRRLSQGGPGLAWYDLDNDGFEDLVMGSGRGGPIQVLRNTRQGRLEAYAEPFLSRPLQRDQTSIVGVEGILFAGSSNYEDGTTNGGCLRLYDFGRKASGENLFGQGHSVGPIVALDFDRDGDLDLFLGGRVVPGRYPEPADSLLVRNDGGRLVLHHRWERLGLVSGAVSSDLDADGWPDLVLATEWGPVRVFRNKDGQFEEITEALGLSPILGWWNGVATGDFDADGRIDIVASNWGANHRFQATAAQPRWLYYEDLGGDLILDLIQAYREPGASRDLPDRGFNAVGNALPWVRDRLGTFEAFAKASLQEIFGPNITSAPSVRVTALESMVLLNRGGRFEPRALPSEAQWAPAFGVSVADFDGDGADDIYLGQNFFAVPPDESRLDAGRGLVLRGDGQGNFRPIAGSESGIQVYGEQRGCAVADFDQDGRVDLAVAQNGAALRVFKNVRARPGLLVRLEGAPGNKRGIGASLRLRCHESWGPRRDLQAGSGYWSQDGALALLATPAPPTELEVRWPGRSAVTYPVPAGARLVSVDISQGLSVLASASSGQSATTGGGEGSRPNPALEPIQPTTPGTSGRLRP